VPTWSPTITVERSTWVTGIFDKHVNVVADVHAEEVHTASDRAAVTERSLLPKLNPDTVTELPPLRAALRLPYDSTAASKLYHSIWVPTDTPTVTVVAAEKARWNKELDEHFTVVADVHAEVLHTASDSAAVAERT
jgi:hypothetical protein